MFPSVAGAQGTGESPHPHHEDHHGELDDCWTSPGSSLGLARPVPSGPADHVCVLVQPACAICASLRSVTADFHEVRDAVKIRVRQARKRATTLLSDPERSLEQRILDEQFELCATQGSQFAGWADPRFLGGSPASTSKPVGLRVAQPTARPLTAVRVIAFQPSRDGARHGQAADFRVQAAQPFRMATEANAR